MNKHPQRVSYEITRQDSLDRGFTLIELLVVIAITGILSVLVILAVSPGRQLAQARNAQRKSDLRAIVNAVQQRTVDARGVLPSGIDTTLRMLGTAFSGCDLLCGTGTIQSVTTTLYPVADTYLYQFTPTTNYGTEDRLQIYPWAPSYHRRTLIHFDLSAIPANASITAADLFLFEAGTYGAQRTITAHRGTRPWTEAGATWSQADTGSPWSTAGGDVVSAPTASTILVWDGILRWHQWDVRSDVSAFVDGTSVNAGWLLKDSLEDSSQAYWFFEARENTNRPYLRIQYTVDPNEPTAASCLDLAPVLAATYVPAIPVDPRSGDSMRTRYALKQAANGRLFAVACRSELNEVIELSG